MGNDGNKELGTYRLIAAWDLALTVPFSVPGINGLAIDALKVLHGALGGRMAFPVFAPLHVFFVSLFGIMCVIWAVVRIHRPSRLLASYDAGGRLVVASFMICFTVAGVSPVPALFSLSEIGWGVVEAVVLLRSRARPA